MAAKIILDSGNLMMHTTSSEFSTRLSILRLVTSKNTSVIAFQGRGALHNTNGMAKSCRRAAGRDLSVYCLQPGNRPPPTGDSPGLWQQWIFGIIATVIVPFFTRKWTNLLKIKDELDTVVEETEKIVDFVEEAAESVDRVAKDVEDHLPEGGKWRNAAVFVEGVAEEIAKDAHLVDNFLHQVEEVEEKVELLVESFEDQTKNVPKDIIAS